jgi:xanthine dehydrogenase YagS FAD-binding subunit
MSSLATGYARPAHLGEALHLLAQPGARPMAGGTDLAGQLDRGLTSASVVVDLQALGLDAITAAGDGVRLGGTATLTAVASAAELDRFACVRDAASAAASPLLRNQGTVGGNLCQHTRCWYYRGLEWTCWLAGGDTCYAQIGEHPKHNLQAGDCISAHPSDLAPALLACDASVHLQSAHGERELRLAHLYRRPTEQHRSLIDLDVGEIVTAVELPAAPDASVYLRVGERRAFSFPLVGVAVARFGGEVRVAAAGVANVPLELDPDDPLAELPGNPQSAWKRTVVETLVARGREAVGG